MAAVGSVKARLRGTDERALAGVGAADARRGAGRLTARPMRELGWQPRPVEESIREAARFWVGLRDAKRKSKQAAERRADAVQ